MIMIPCRHLPLAYLIVLLATWSLGVFLRFHNIDGPGVWGSDAVYYTEIAKSWSEGDFVYQIGTYQVETVQRVCRPATFALFAAAIRVFGFHDYSIKMINAIMDSINILLVFAVCYLLADKRAWPALAAAGMYAFFPPAIYMSRGELTHTSSTFMVLLSFFAFTLYCRAEEGGKRYPFVILSGLFSGFAALTHEELIFVAPSYAAILLTHSILADRRWVGIKRLLADLGLLTVAAVLGCLNMILFYLKYPPPQSFVESDVANFGGKLLSFPEKWGRFLWSSLLGSSSTVVLCLFILLLLIAIARVALRPTRWKLPGFDIPHLFHAPLAVVLIHLAFLAYFIPYYPLRIFLPMLPLVLVAIALWFSHFFERFGSRYAGVASMSLAFVVVFFNVAHYPGYYTREGVRFSQSWAVPTLETDVVTGVKTIRHFIVTKTAPRFWYDLLGDRVNENARLLVTSSIMHPYPGRRALQMDYYFGDNAIYMIDHNEPLEELIEKYKIRFILISAYHATESFLDRSTYQRYEYDGKWGMDVPLLLGASYGFRPGQYSLEEEFRFLTEYLERRRSAILFSGGPAHPTQLPKYKDLTDALLAPEFSYVIFEW